MKVSHKVCSVLFLLLFFLNVPLGADQEQGGRHTAIDVVICLDISGSMQNLLDGVRIRIWDVVAELAHLQPNLELRVGVLAYGTGSLSAEDGWMSVKVDLTHDLDAVFAALMDLEIGGSEELVARAVTTAVETMAWSPYPDALKILFVAGNEPIYMDLDGERELHDAFALAKRENVIVNALYAGSREEALREKWTELAQGGRGNFSAIDARFSQLQVATPQDEALLELNARLNMTYVPYGPRGSDGFANQTAQDINATRFGVESCSSRIVAKGSALYTNASWDLVDASLVEDFSWDDLRDEDLPEELRGLETLERAKYILAKRAEREAIQKTIQEVSAEREAYLRKAPRRVSQGAEIGDAFLEAIRAQILDD